MSIRLMAEIWDNAPRIEGTKLLVLLALADMANDSGICWPSYATIAKRARIKRRQAINVMDELVTAGYISKTGRAKENEQISNSYFVNIAVIRAGGSAIAVTPPSAIQDTTPSAIAVTPPSAIAIAPEPSINHHSEPSENNINNAPEFSAQYGDYERVYVQETKSPLLTPNPRKWFEGMEGIAKTGITADDFREVIRQYLERGYAFNGPSSFVNWCVNYQARKSATKPRGKSSAALAVVEDWKGAN